jgi:hypothetical protein
LCAWAAGRLAAQRAASPQHAMHEPVSIDPLDDIWTSNLQVMAASSSSAETLTSRKSAAQSDVEAALRDSNCADSCTSLDDYGRPCSSPARSSAKGSGGGSGSGSGSDTSSGMLDWRSDQASDDGDEVSTWSYS